MYKYIVILLYTIILFNIIDITDLIFIDIISITNNNE